MMDCAIGHLIDAILLDVMGTGNVASAIMKRIDINYIVMEVAIMIYSVLLLSPHVFN